MQCNRITEYRKEHENAVIVIMLIIKQTDQKMRKVRHILRTKSD